MSRARLLLLLTAAAVAVGGVQCRAATVVRVQALSEVDCSKGARVALVVAADPAGFQAAVPASVSMQCGPASGAQPGEFDYGSVVVAPASSKDEPIAFEILTQVDGLPPETCLDPAQFGRCIKASRQLRFAPHQETTVPIELRNACLGVVCPSGQTCLGSSGQCVDDHLPTGCAACGEGSLAPSTAPACGDVSGLQAGAPWPMAGYCPTRPGRSGRNGPQNPTVRWTFAMGAIATMNPAVGADGTIYVGSNDRVAYAVDPSGNLRWKAGVGGNINDSGFVVGSDGTVYIGASDSNVYAFAPGGVRRWATSVGADVATTLVAGAGGTLYVTGLASSSPSGPAPLFALASDTGTPRWQLPPDFGTGAVAIGVDGTLYVSGTDSKLHALRPTDGSTVWTAPTQSAASTPSVGDDGTIYVVDAHALYAFAPAGTPVWTTPVDGLADGVALAADGTIYVPTHPGTLWAVAPDGTVRWKLANTAGWHQQPIVGGDGTVYLGGGDGALYAVSPAGNVLWTVPTGGGIGSQPALGADGTLYVVSSDDHLYAIGP